MFHHGWQVVGGFDAAWNIPKWLLPKLQPGREKKHTALKTAHSACVCVSAGPVCHSMWIAIWRCSPTIKEALDLRPGVMAAAVGQRRLPRTAVGRRGGASAAAVNSGNMLEPSVVYFCFPFSLRLTPLRQPTRSGATALILPVQLPLPVL